MGYRRRSVPHHKNDKVSERRQPEANGNHCAELPKEIAWRVLLMRLSDRLIRLGEDGRLRSVNGIHFCHDALRTAAQVLSDMTWRTVESVQLAPRCIKNRGGATARDI